MRNVFALAAFALGGLWLAGCASSPRLAEAKCPHCAAVANAPKAAASTDSLYVGGAEWTTADEQRLALRELAGRPCLLSFFFTECGLKCPITVGRMQAIEAALPRDLREQTRFVLVSIDPTNDTPAKLRAYRSAHGLNASRWLLLCGSAVDVAALAQRAGFTFQRTAAGSFAHDSVIAVLDPQGKIAARHDGLYAGADTLAAQVRAVLP